jgi:hypothetical protein
MLPGKPEVPELDLAFAVSATAANADNTFAQMKETINSIVEKYGSNKIHYGFIVFGSTASIKVNLGEEFPSDEKLKNFIASTPRTRGRPSLDNALNEAKTLFEGRAARPKAKKVLVIILDKQSDTSSSVIQSRAKSVMDKGVKVIPVAIGNEVDPTQLTKTTDDNENLIEEPVITDPVILGEKIMEKALKGKNSKDTNVLKWT